MAESAGRPYTASEVVMEAATTALNRRDFLGRSAAVLAGLLPRPEPIYVGIRPEGFNASYAEQESEHWCWAACIQMVLDYHGVFVTQEQIVARSFHVDPRGRLPDFGATFELISRNLNNSGVDLTGRRYRVRAKFGRGAPSPVLLLDELSAQFPVLFCYRTDDDSGHVVVATGASYFPGYDGPIVESLVVRDPWPSPENRWAPGEREYRARLASRITAHWLIRVM
jgi:Papain-like cysteine protease AvrRpt2